MTYLCYDIKGMAHSHLKCNVADFSSGSDKREFTSFALLHRKTGVRRWRKAKGASRRFAAGKWTPQGVG